MPTVNVFTRPVTGVAVDPNTVRGQDNALGAALNTLDGEVVKGPASSTDNAVMRWDGTTGKLAQDSGVLVDDAGKLTFATATTATASATVPHGTAPTSPVDGDVWTTTAGLFVRVNGTTVGPLGDVFGPSSATDNAVARFDGTTGKVVQNSPVTIADNGKVNVDGSATTDVLTVQGLARQLVLKNGTYELWVGAGVGGAIYQNVNGAQIHRFVGDMLGEGSLQVSNQLYVADAITPTSFLTIDTASSGTVSYFITGGGTRRHTFSEPLVVAGAVGTATRTEISNYSITTSDSLILADASSLSLLITLPSVTDANKMQFTIKKIDSSANTVTIDGNGSETIDGATTAVITMQWESVTVQSNGTAWYIL